MPVIRRLLGFLADLKIDIRERQEAVARLNKFRVKDDDGSLVILQDLQKRFLDQQSKFQRFQE